MAIATLAPTIKSRVKLVFSTDPDVEPKDPAHQGWIPLPEATVKPGADVVEVRPLNVDERMESGDVGGLRASMLARARAALCTVNGDKDKKVREAFLNACPTDVVFLLGCAVMAITSGDDIHVAQAIFFGGEEAEGEDEGEAEGEA